MNSNSFMMNDIDILDILNLYEIYRSRQKEQKSDNLTNNLIHALAYEIQKLHEENERIITQNEEILKMLSLRRAIR